MQDPGWDPYESSMVAIKSVLSVLRGKLNSVADRHLALWLYGHIVEASEPYEFLGNLIDVSVGGKFKILRFPAKNGRIPLSPGKKIELLSKQASEAGISDVVVPMREAWNPDFRNAIFHADYCLYGSEVRTIRPLKRYDQEEVLTIVNRALAYHEALSGLRRGHVANYSEPERIACDPSFSDDPDETAVVIVRRGFGAVGIKDGWTKEQLGDGKIPFRLGRFTVEESKMLESDPTLAVLPERKEVSKKTAPKSRFRKWREGFRRIFCGRFDER